MDKISPEDAFQLPVAIDMAAAYLFGLTGSVIAMKRGYDFVGLFSLGFITALGGGLIRDAMLIRDGAPAAISDPRYFWIILAACISGVFVSERIHRWARFVAAIDALGLAAYAVVGAERSLLAGLPPSAAVMIGVVNACGGGVMRDVLCREEPLLFQPGQFYAMAALAGASFFTVVTSKFHLAPTEAAIYAMTLTFLVRILAITFNWQTKAIRWGAPVVPLTPSAAPSGRAMIGKDLTPPPVSVDGTILDLAPPSSSQTLFQASLSSLDLQVPPPEPPQSPEEPSPPTAAVPSLESPPTAEHPPTPSCA